MTQSAHSHSRLDVVDVKSTSNLEKRSDLYYNEIDENPNKRREASMPDFLLRGQGVMGSAEVLEEVISVHRQRFDGVEMEAASIQAVSEIAPVTEKITIPMETLDAVVIPDPVGAGNDDGDIDWDEED